MPVTDRMPRPPFLDLHPRQRELLHHLLNENSLKEISFEMGIAKTSVGATRDRLFAQLGVRTLQGLVKLAIEKGYWVL